MKKNKLLTISTSLLLLLGVAACNNQTTSSTSSTSSSVSEVESSEESSTRAIDDAKTLLFQLYKDTYKDGTATTSDFQLVAAVISNNVEYKVEWKVEIKEGGLEEAVKVGETADKKTTINVKYDAEYSVKDTFYDLVATISLDGEAAELKFENIKVPAFVAKTIAQWLKEKDTETPTVLQGVVTAVNKTDKAGSFTITDETGSVFSYDNPSQQVELGDEVVLTSIYSDFNGFPQLKAPTIVRVVAKNQLDKVSSKLEEIDINTINSNLANYVSDPTSISTKYIKIKNAFIYKNGTYATLATSADATSYCVNLYYHSSSEMVEKAGAQVDVIGVVRGVGSSYITFQVQSYEVTKEAGTDPDVPPVTAVESTIADFVAAKDKETLKKLTGTITAVNKVGEAGAFVLSDATSSVFCYAGADVKLGDKVVMTGVYTENYKFPQLGNPTLVQTISTGNDVVAASGTAKVVTASTLVSEAAATDHTDLIANYAGKYVSITEGYIIKSGNFYGVGTASTDTSYKIDLYANYGINVSSYEGKKVTVFGFARGTNSSKGKITIQVQSISEAA